MTIDRHKGELFCICDECGEELKDKRGSAARYEPDDFDVLVSDLRDAGWRISKEGSVYEHHCPDCQE